MLQKNHSGIYQFTELVDIPWLVHGFSSIEHGNMRDKQHKRVTDIKLLSDTLDISSDDIVGMHQVHSAHVVTVNIDDKGKILEETDGLIVTKPEIFVYVCFADCQPLLFIDQENKRVGVAHAGREGIYNDMAGAMVDAFVAQGSLVKNIEVFIGPSIRSCCYDIPKDIANRFSRKMHVDNYLTTTKGKLFLDLPLLTTVQLQQKGIRKNNIVDVGICTEHEGLFFSYRAQNKDKNYSLNAAIIGIR